jgi:hypothetical protein
MNSTEELSSLSFVNLCTLAFPVLPVGEIPTTLKLIIVPINGEEFEHSFEVTACPTTQIKGLHNWIYGGLREEMLVGQFYWFTLKILPLQATSTLEKLKQQGLAVLCKKAQ